MQPVDSNPGYSREQFIIHLMAVIKGIMYIYLFHVFGYYLPGKFTYYIPFSQLMHSIDTSKKGTLYILTSIEYNYNRFINKIFESHVTYRVDMTGR